MSAKTEFPLTMARIYQRAATVMEAQNEAAQIEARAGDQVDRITRQSRVFRERDDQEYSENKALVEAEQPTERWTNATHHSLGNGCYRVRRQGGAQ